MVGVTPSGLFHGSSGLMSGSLLSSKKPYIVSDSRGIRVELRRFQSGGRRIHYYGESPRGATLQGVGCYGRPRQVGFIKQLTSLESQLSSIQFPAYGSLYLSESSNIPNDKRVILPSDIDSSGSYFVGPSSDRSWMVVGAGTVNHDFNPGPCRHFPGFGDERKS